MKLLILLAIAVGVFLFYVSRRPSDFRISRSALITAPASAIFAHINDFHNWEAWSPWAKMDPNAKNTFEGAEQGVGAIFKWSGNNKVGEGMMTLQESQPDEVIRIKLDFIKPFTATNTSEFMFAPEGEQTRVTWSMYGVNNLMAKVMDIFMNCDKMVGGQFEEGLANIKAIVESQSQTPSTTEETEITG